MASIFSSQPAFSKPSVIALMAMRSPVFFRIWNLVTYLQYFHFSYQCSVIGVKYIDLYFVIKFLQQRLLHLLLHLWEGSF